MAPVWNEMGLPPGGAAGGPCWGQRGETKADLQCQPTLFIWRSGSIHHDSLLFFFFFCSVKKKKKRQQQLHLPCSSPLHPTFTVQWSTFHERHLKVGLNGLIFPIMTRRRSLTPHALCCCCLPACLPGLHSLYCTLRKSLKRDGESEINPHFLFLTSNSKREERREGIVDSGSEGNVSHFMLVVENQGSLSLSLSLFLSWCFFFFFTHTLLQWRQQQFSSGFTFSSDQLRESERERERQKERGRERERQQPQEQEDSAFSSLLPTAVSARRAPPKTAPATGRDARRKYYRATGIFFLYIFFFFYPFFFFFFFFFFLFYVCFAGFEQRHTQN